MPPAITSGTVGRTQFNTRLVFDHAFRACKLAPQQITSEYLRVATEQCGLMLMSWANEGVPLWCQNKEILALVQGDYSLDVGAAVPGVVDILQANLRQCARFTGIYTSSEGVAANAFDGDPTTACTQLTQGGNITLQLPTAMAVENVGVMPAISAVWDGILFQYSNDGQNWTTFGTLANVQGVAGQFIWLDFQGLPAALYWRLQADPVTIMSVAELFFGNNAQEIPISRINQDDYWNLPNKTFQGRPVQYWCDRQISGPVMWLWPSPGAPFVFQQVTALVHRHIMDVGLMTNSLELPPRAFDAAVFSLAERLRLVIVEVDKKATADIPVQAMQARKLFWGEEVDRSPILLQRDLSAYTA